jgi:hypothetical protein
MPNFLVIGAMRSGTTALYSFLGQHPDVYMSPVKEPNFFAFGPGEDPGPVEGSLSLRDRDEYLRLFSGVQAERRIGEASHSYMYYPGAIDRIGAELADAKLICILRDPASRAFSHYIYHLRNGQEDAPDFETALNMEKDRMARGVQRGHYVARGFYAKQIRKVLEVFPRDALRVYLFEDLSERPAWLMRDVFGFLDVDESFEADTSIRRNPSGLPRSGMLHRILVGRSRLKRRLQPILPKSLYRLATRIRDRNLVRPDLDPEIRERLVKTFRDDIRDLEELIDRDLSAWLAW